MSRFIVAGLLAVALSGCSKSSPQGSDIDAAALVDNQPVADNPVNAVATEEDTSSTETLGTSFIGKLEESDLARFKQAQTTAFQQERGGVPIVWRNPDTSHSGQVTSGPIYTINGRRCRDFIQFITIDGAQESENGVACQQSDGVWASIAS
ncbi:MAG: RT0821/Lpp0805 family surface protein [Hyphomicrobiales bacterium]